MEDKKQDLNSSEELVKIADSYRAFFDILANEFSRIIVDIKELEQEEDTEDTWEMKCPYKIGDEYYYVYGDGCVRTESWDNFSTEISRWRSGNTFPTKEEAELEAKRRNLLTRFRAFRDECNVDWKADWRNYLENKHYIYFGENVNFKIYNSSSANEFSLFGYFKNKADAKRAIELFGDEIKELFVEGEA